LVEVDVRGAQPLPVVPFCGLLTRDDGSRDPLYAGRRALDSPDRRTLDELAHLVKINDVADRQLPDEYPAVELVGDQPLVAQQLECLAESVAGHPEIASDLLGQAGPWTVIAVGDAGAEHISDAFRGGALQQHAVGFQGPPLRGQRLNVPGDSGAHSSLQWCPQARKSRTVKRRLGNKATYLLFDRPTIL
jgi:hypothetical protein